MRKSITRTVVLCLSVQACAGPAGPHAAARNANPASYAAARPPTATGGSQAYQDDRGAAAPIGSAPALYEGGSQAYPPFPRGKEPQIRTPPDFLIQPGGGERPVDSLNALASPPCLMCN